MLFYFRDESFYYQVSGGVRRWRVLLVGSDFLLLCVCVWGGIHKPRSKGVRYFLSVGNIVLVQNVQ